MTSVLASNILSGLSSPICCPICFSLSGSVSGHSRSWRWNSAWNSDWRKHDYSVSHLVPYCPKAYPLTERSQCLLCYFTHVSMHYGTWYRHSRLYCKYDSARPTPGLLCGWRYQSLHGCSNDLFYEIKFYIDTLTSEGLGLSLSNVSRLKFLMKGWCVRHLRYDLVSMNA